MREIGDPAQSPEDGRKSKVLEKQAGVPDEGFPPLSGHCVSCHLSMGAEIDQRIWATNRAWTELYGMWWNKRVPYKIKRTLFRGAVCGASSTGLTALLLHDRDYLRLQGCLEKKLRALLLGTSSWEGPDHTRTLSSRQVWKRWRMAPPAYELCVQRLRRYQSIAREPARHAHLLCCWFGRMHFESHDTLIEGLRLHPEANGYAKRSLADLQTLAFVPEWAEQVANVELEFGDVFRLGSKLDEWFLSLDLRQIRAAFFTQTVAPCRVELRDDEGDDDLEGENEYYTCTWLGEDGWECGERWSTARALATRQHHTQGGTHGETKGVASLVVANQCFWCASTHASIETTSKPMQLQKNTTDAGRFHYPVIDILLDSICPRCDLIFNDTASTVLGNLVVGQNAPCQVFCGPSRRRIQLCTRRRLPCLVRCLPTSWDRRFSRVSGRSLALCLAGRNGCMDANPWRWSLSLTIFSALGRWLQEVDAHCPTGACGHCGDRIGIPLTALDS